MEKHYEIEGVILSNQDYLHLLTSLAITFLPSEFNWNNRKNRKPLWVHIKNDLPSKRLDSMSLHHIILPGNSYYFWFESRGEIKQVIGSEIVAFFANKPPWVEHDYYVIPSNNEWCLVCTHDDEYFVVCQKLSPCFPHIE